MESEGTQPYVYVYPFSSKLASYPGCHITLSRVPYAIQEVSLLALVFFLFDENGKKVLFYLEKYAYKVCLTQHALFQTLPRLEMNKLMDECMRRIKNYREKSYLLYMEKEGNSRGSDYSDDAHTHTSWHKSLETM